MTNLQTVETCHFGKYSFLYSYQQDGKILTCVQGTVHFVSLCDLFIDRRRLNTQVLLTENVEGSPRVFFLRVYYVRPMAEGATVKSPLVNVTCKTFQVSAQ